MIELPEALVIARQLDQELSGKMIEFANRGNSPHKFAFYSEEPEHYEEILSGKVIGQIRGHGPFILMDIEPAHLLILGYGGERIVLHQNEATLPQKYQLLIRFVDNSLLTVTVQGWGFVQLIEKTSLASHPYAASKAFSPLSSDFTYEYFLQLINAPKEKETRSVKAFMISKPGVWGVGNGCLQDILFHAGIHPKRRLVDVSEDERYSLYQATKETLRQMAEQGGRDSELDLYNQPGQYQRILHSKRVGRPCPKCETPIEKINYLGGASYFCPKCQR